MTPLDPSALAGVTGGAATEARITTPVGSARVTQSDYARCVDTVQRQVDQQYPRPSWPWQTDQNAAARSKAMLEALPRVCGIPGQ